MKKSEYNPLTEHTKEKLAIYSEYLPAYLGILAAAAFNDIRICDMFAGKGTYEIEGSDVKGSAILAFDAIKEILKKPPRKNITLRLNDNDPKCYKSLMEKTNPSINKFVKCTQLDATEAIEENVSEDPGINKLFFLDPFGYTQVRKPSIDTIICDGSSKNECLLFVPVTFIAHFFSQSKPASEQEPSIANFCNDYGIDMEKSKDIKWHQLGITIKTALRDIYSSSFVGFAPLQASSSNYYALYFIGNHIYGLEKFLESVRKVSKHKIDQPKLFPVDKPIMESYLSLSEPRTNCEIYEYSLREGITPPEAREILSSMEERGEISVESLTGEKRNRTWFYLSYDNYYKDGRKVAPKINVRLSTKGTKIPGGLF